MHWTLSRSVISLVLVGSAVFAQEPSSRPSSSDPINSAPESSPHEDIRRDTDSVIPPGSKGLVTEILVPKLPFNELLPSWNIDLPKDLGVSVEVMVKDDKTWSPWLHIGDWGSLPKGERRLSWAHGAVAIDIFKSAEVFQRARFRFRIHAKSGSGKKGPGKVTLKRLHVCFSDTRKAISPQPPSRNPNRKALEIVPIRQGSAPSDISGRICSPTSVTMVLGKHGKAAVLTEVAAQIHDPYNAIYGVWNRAVQAAWERGVPGYLTRISSWDDVLSHTDAGRPVIISIAAKKGQLRNAPYSQTAGHLLVVLGMDSKDMVVVADPAAASLATVRRVYFREDLDTVWMARGGTCYILGH